MSRQPDVSVQSDAKASSSADKPATDSNFEFLDQTADTVPDSNNEPIYWYASPDSSQPIGPVSSLDIRKQISSGEIDSASLVWHNGMQSWEHIADHFDIPTLASLPPESCLPPPLPRIPASRSMPEFFDFVGNWEPSVFLLRCVARFTIALGLLVIVLSLALAPFGMSSFSGALQIVLIGLVLELTGIVRSAIPSGAVAGDAFATPVSTHDRVPGTAEGQLPR